MNGLFIDIACKQNNCGIEHICGDTFLFKRSSDNNRTVIVLSDGMGHGIKANILSTLTASMIMNFDIERYDVAEIASMVLKTLPVCSVRKVSYSTFTIADIDRTTGKAVLMQHDNPLSLIYRNGELLEINWTKTIVQGSHRPQVIQTASFDLQPGDRIILSTDGVTQSGNGTERYAFGWGEKNLHQFVRQIIQEVPTIHAQELANRIVCQAVQNDADCTKDDISCAVVHIREPRRAMICTCPPYSEKENEPMIRYIYGYNGRKIICGYHLAMLVSDLTGHAITRQPSSPDPDLQPAWSMPGIDLITESLTTMNKILDILEHYDRTAFEEGPAFDACRILLSSDQITLLVGMRHGNGGMYMVDEFELRRKVIKRIGHVLEKRFMKEVNYQYL